MDELFVDCQLVFSLDGLDVCDYIEVTDESDEITYNLVLASYEDINQRGINLDEPVLDYLFDLIEEGLILKAIALYYNEDRIMKKPIEVTDYIIKDRYNVIKNLKDMKYI
jgi:hypothetical protein